MARGKPFVQPVQRLVQCGVVRRPLWMGTLERIPPQVELRVVTKVPQLVYPEDKLRSNFLRLNPEYAQLPVNLKATRKSDAHIADRFAAAQLALMQEGMTEEAAYSATLGNLEEQRQQIMKNQETVRKTLVDPSVQDGPSRLYLASLRDSESDQELADAIEKSDPMEPASAS